MTYARIENGNVVEYPIYEGEIKLRYPNISFPTPFLAPAGYTKVIDTPRPLADHTKNVIEGELINSNDTWKRTWIIVDASSEEITTRTEAAALNVRITRNQRLAASDWRVTYEVEKAAIDGLGIQYPQVWATYRQALRDITLQPGFPHNVTWPDEPTI